MHPDAAAIVVGKATETETETEDDHAESSDWDSPIDSARRAVDSANASWVATGRAATQTAPSSGGA
jgi:hypothetical protein